MRVGVAGPALRWVSVLLLIPALLIGMTGAGNAAYQRPGRIELASPKKVPGKVCPFSNANWSGISVSDNGRYVAFSSGYCDLVPGDDNQEPDVFRYDRMTKEIELVSVSSQGTMAVYPPLPASGSYRSSISADGRYVSFDSNAINLVPGHIGATRRDVYVRDMKAGSTELISTPLPQKIPDPFGNSEFPSISADGRRVAFESVSSDLWDDEPNPNNDGASKIFVYDRRQDSLKLASVDSEGNRPSRGNPSLTNSFWPSISGNGRVVMFTSHAMDLVDDDTSIWADVFVHDLRTRVTERVSVATGGRQANVGMQGTGSSEEGAISHDGNLVVFASGLQDYVPNDTHKYPRDTLAQGDVFLHDRRTGRTERISVNSFGEEVSEGSGLPVLSPDGRYVSFTGSSDLADGEAPSFPQVETDVFLHDRKMGTVERVAVSNSGEPSDCQTPSRNLTGDVSRGGRFVSFLSCATNLAGSGRHEEDPLNDEPSDVYLRDRGTDLGAGVGGTGRERDKPDDDFLICLPDLICFPSYSYVGSAASSEAGDPLGKSLPGANLTEVSVAHRPALGDLFVREELERMAPLGGLTEPLLYGFDLRAAGTRYQVRVQLNPGPASTASFGLFEWAGGAFTEVARLRGGYGTIGHNVAFSIPLEFLGLEGGGRVGELSAFTALGTYDLGPERILKRIRVRSGSGGRAP